MAVKQAAMTERLPGRDRELLNRGLTMENMNKNNRNPLKQCQHVATSAGTGRPSALS
jgi:hypothetical protein